jgi:hypothetical protein
MRTWVTLGIFIAVLAAAFSVYALHISESTPPKPEASVTGAAITDISITDTYKKGVHTIKGTATVPTPCTLLSADISASSSTPPVIRIDLTAPLDEGMCLHVPKTVPFTLTVTAPADASTTVYANTVLATTTP